MRWRDGAGSSVMTTGSPPNAIPATITRATVTCSGVGRYNSGVGDGLDQLEQTAARLRIRHPVVGSYQFQRFPAHIGSGSYGAAAGSCKPGTPSATEAATAGLMSSKKNETGTSRTRLRSKSLLAPIRFAPRSYFCTC